MASQKLHGRAFYESIGSPKHVLAPMVDQSEFAWRMLSRSFLAETERRSILTYSPMLHAKLFSEKIKYRNENFKPLKEPFRSPGDKTKPCDDAEKPFLDGNPANDRPLFVQFCANDPEVLLASAKEVAPFCDAVDLNLGCPQGIAKRGHYGAFLQEDWETIYKMINTLHTKLDIPVTAKMRILETRERTLEYAKMILSAGASIITVHGRQREQKGHNTGVADWSMIRFLRENLPSDTVMFANGNILQHDDVEKCMQQTGVDGVMTAEGNLYDPAIFAATPAAGENDREYWTGKDGLGGWRCDAVVRRYFDIIYTHVLGQHPPTRKPLWIPSDGPLESVSEITETQAVLTKEEKRAAHGAGKPKHDRPADVNLTSIQAHLFNVLRAMVKHRHDIRNLLATTRAGDMPGFERVLALIEHATREAITAYNTDPASFDIQDEAPLPEDIDPEDETQCSRQAVRRCHRPWFVCQPYIRPLPKEALAKGAMQLSKKDVAAKRKLEEEGEFEQARKVAKVAPTTEVVTSKDDQVEVPREGLVCG